MGIESCDFGTICSAHPDEPLSHPDSCEFLSSFKSSCENFSSQSSLIPNVVLSQGNQSNVPAIWGFLEGYPQYTDL